MSISRKKTDNLMADDLPIAELKSIEHESKVHLDDDSIRVLGRVRTRNLLSDKEWGQIKGFLRDALRFLSEPQKTVRRETGGTIVIDPDADPRNADWLRIHAADRMAGHVLPMWAALWLWWLRTDSSLKFWRSVGKIANELGYEPFVPEDDK